MDGLEDVTESKRDKLLDGAPLSQGKKGLLPENPVMIKHNQEKSQQTMCQKYFHLTPFAFLEQTDKEKDKRRRRNRRRVSISAISLPGIPIIHSD